MLKFYLKMNCFFVKRATLFYDALTAGVLKF